MKLVTLLIYKNNMFEEEICGFLGFLQMRNEDGRFVMFLRANDDACRMSYHGFDRPYEWSWFRSDFAVCQLSRKV